MKFAMAIAVVLLHCHAFIDYSEMLDFVVTDVLTRVAVPFFFICSGWLLFRKMSIGEIDFYRVKKTTSRLVRMYFFWTLIYIPLICYEIMSSSIEYGETAKKIILLLRNCVMVGSYYHFWFLISLVWGILIVTWMLKRKWTYKKMFFLAGGLYSITLLAHSYYGLFTYFFSQESAGFNLVHQLAKIFVTPRGIGMGPIFVLLGNWIAWHPYRYSTKKIIYLCCMFGFLYFVEAMLTFYGGINPHNGQSYIMLVPFSFFFFMLVVRQDIFCKKQEKVFRHLRQMSMLIYCVHPLFLSVTLYYMKNEKIDISSLMIFSIVLVMSYIFAEILVRLSRINRFMLLKWLM